MPDETGSGLRLLPCGDAALLVEVDGLDEVLALHAGLLATPPAGVRDLVPAARTVLIQFDPAATTRTELAAAVRSVAPRPATLAEVEPVRIAVRYDGADLAEVGRLTGLGPDGVVAAHSGAVWTVAFGGFLPGFGYLVGGDPRLHVPRRAESRTRVPAGSVGLAGEFTGVYPRASPGGWQLIGRTEERMWDVERDPPALLRPGVQVRFDPQR